nr:hypothetical protein [Nocardioides ungokensis]
MAQQVAVVDGAQPEILEAPVVGAVDRLVELARVGLDEARGGVTDQPLEAAEPHRLAERRDLLAGDLLLDVRRQQPGGQSGVLRLVGGQLRSRLDRQPVELRGRGAVVQPGDRAGRDGQRLDVRQAVGAALDRPDDLVQVDRLRVAVALAHHHRGAGGARVGTAGWGVDLGHVLLSPRELAGCRDPWEEETTTRAPNPA